MKIGNVIDLLMRLVCPLQTDFWWLQQKENMTWPFNWGTYAGFVSYAEPLKQKGAIFAHNFPP